MMVFYVAFKGSRNGGNHVLTSRVIIGISKGYNIIFRLKLIQEYILFYSEQFVHYFWDNPRIYMVHII